MATRGLPLVQVPPPASVREVVPPGHTSNTPVIPAGDGLTVTMVLVEQPVDGKE